MKGNSMDKRVVLVSHNRLAEGMAGTVKMIFGADVEVHCLTPDGSVVELGRAVREGALAHPDAQTVVVADILGGSVCNQCLQDLYGMDNVKVVAGMSLPLVIGLLSIDGALSDADIEQAIEDARATTQLVTLEMADDPANAEDDFF